MRLMILPIWLAAGAFALADQPRTWSDSSGKFHTDAEFVSIDSGLVTLKVANGKLVKVPFDRLDEAGRKEVDRLKAAPAPGTPFIEVLTNPAEATAAILRRMSDRIEEFSAANEKTKDSTGPQRDAARDGLAKALTADIGDKTLVFRFPITDVVVERKGTVKIKLDAPAGVEGISDYIRYFDLPIKKGAATNISKGDTLILSGLGVVSAQASSVLQDDRDKRKGFGICELHPENGDFHCTVRIRGLEHRIEKKK